jgi:aryl-alcohol dehydrogenase-like predicted oxidoreductase
MEYRRMGKTGLQLSVLSFGSWVSFHKQIDDKIADELMSIAYDNGVNFLTTLKYMPLVKVKK